MIITAESQERLVTNYERTHPESTHKEVTAYIVGLRDMMKLIDKKMREEKEIYQSKEQ